MKSNFIDHVSPLEAINEKELAYDTLLEMVREEAVTMVESTNRLDNDNTSSKTKSESNQAQSIADSSLATNPIEAFRMNLIEAYADNIPSTDKDVLTPRKALKTTSTASRPKTIKRSKLINLIKAEILKTINLNEQKRRRNLALRKLNKK